ncbi:MAG: hypothetical protein JO257_10375 [Deltaproteobacteria bacterium]|nr:hypothetical protein [Deltaproteobacteria bacterium]
MIFLHVSELSIDRLLAGELPAGDVAAMRDHAAACDRCGLLLADALAAKREVLPRLPLPRSRAPYIAAIGALAAAGVLVASWPHPQPTVRTKGTPVLGFYVSHEGRVRLGHAHEALDRGDAIELYTTSEAPKWVAVVGADHTVYLPPTVVPASREHLLPMSIVLDGSDTLTAMFCDERFELAAPPSDCTLDHVTVVMP